MKKILLLGSCGAGKSTLATRMREILGIQVIHLDQHYWKPNWERPGKEEWQKKVSDLVKEDSWIMDGNYRGSLDIRLPHADTIIFLDFPSITCAYRVLKRRLKKDRRDTLDGCDERVNLDLLRWVLWTFPRENRKELYNKINELESGKKAVILKSNKDVEVFLDKVKKDLD